MSRRLLSQVLSLVLPHSPLMVMHSVFKALIVGVLILPLAGCKATPAKVCRHLAVLGAENSAECVPFFENVQARAPQYWDSIGDCVLAAEDASGLSTCDGLVDLVRAQTLCDEVLERVPDAYEASMARCLDTQYGVLKDDDSAWEAHEKCIMQANNADAVHECTRR